MKNEYFISDANTFWTLDVTQRGLKRISYILAVIDGASRCIINYAYSETTFETSSLIDLLEQTINKYQKPKYIHSDQGGIFVSDDFTAFLNHHNILRSLTIKDDSTSHWGNQVHEVFHRDFWLSIGIDRKSKETIQAWDDLNQTDRIRLIDYTIEIYNHSNATVRPDYTRDELDKALRCETALKFNLKAKNDTELAKLIERFHFYTILRNGGDYISSLIDQTFNPSNVLAISMIPQLAQHEVVVESLIREQTMLLTKGISSAFIAVVEELKHQREEHQKARQLNEELRNKIEDIQMHTTELYTKQKMKETLRERRKNRKRQISRDACTFSDFLIAL